MIKRLCILIIILFSLNILLTSCSLSDALGVKPKNTEGQMMQRNNDDIMDSGPVKGGVLNIFSTIPDTLNPILTNNIYVHDFSLLIYESLIHLDKDQKPEPLLSDSWDISGDGLTWTFHIKDNVYWQDRMPFTAEDVEFTVGTILNSKVNTVYKTNVENIAAFTALDRSHFRIILKKPNSYTAELMTFPILPKHYYSGEDIVTSKRNMTPLGTGPYKFLSYDGKTSLRMILDENWWKVASKNKNEETLPYIGEINVKLYQKGKDALNAFQTRDIDVAPITTDEFGKYSGRTDLLLRKYTSSNYEFIALNLTKSILADKVVRQALAYAIDKKKIIDNVLPGKAVAADIPVIPDTWLYDNDIISYNASPGKAKEILLQNGWKEDKAKNVLYRPGKGALNLELLVNDDNSDRAKVADQIAKQLAEAGITLKITKLKWDDLFKRINSKRYDMALLGWKVPSFQDVSFAYSSSEIATGFNVSGYKNPEVDEYLINIALENDYSKKKALFQNMRSVIDDEVPYIGLYFYNNAVLFSKRIRGDLNPTLENKYNDIAKWYIPVQ